MQRSLRFHLILAFALVVGVFAVASAFVLYCIHRSEMAMHEVDHWEEAVRYGLTLASCGRDQYIHEAHMLISGEAVHADHVRVAATKMRDCQEHVRMAAATPEEIQAIDELDRTAEEFRNTFFDEIVPAVRQGDEARARELHSRSEELLARIVGLNDTLSASFRRQIEAAKAEARHLSRQAVWVTLVVVLVAVATAAGVGLHLGRSILGPIQDLMAATEIVARGDLSPADARTDIRELAALSDSFERMKKDLRDRQNDLVQAEKRASLGDLAAGVAHQINNPLGVILGYARLLAQGKLQTTDQLQKAHGIIEEEAGEAKTIVETLLSLARPGRLAFEEVDAADLLDDTVQHVRRYRPNARARIELEATKRTLRLRTDPRKLGQALINLVVNGLEAMPEGGTLRLRAGQTGNGDESRAVFEVQDEGPGLSPEARTRLFDPYFTTKKSGTGLGLALTHEIVRALGGRIEAVGASSCGCIFRIEVPLSPASAEER